MPTWEYEAGKEITELPQWSLFDAILIKPVEHFEGVYKDNGGHFFKYQPDPNLPVDVLELLKKLQIFYSLDAPELNDCCFIYAVKQTGRFTDEQLNLMRMRIRSRYLSNKSIDEIAKEFRFKVNVCRIDLETAPKHKKDNFVVGYEEAAEDMTFKFDLYDEHYMIHIDRTSSKHIYHVPFYNVFALRHLVLHQYV